MTRMKIAIAVMLLAATLGAVVFSPRDSALDEINRRRVRHDCRALIESSDRLIASARQHSQEMASVGDIFHTDNLRISNWSRIGEIVGVAGSTIDVVRAFFQSPPHRRLLLDCRYDVMAIGLVFEDGSVWMTGRLYAR